MSEWEKNLTEEEKFILRVLRVDGNLYRKNFEKNSDRKIRGWISGLRRYVPIINLQDGKGYFIPDKNNPDDVEKAFKWYKQEYNRAISTLVTLAPTREFLSTVGQVDMSEYMNFWESEPVPIWKGLKKTRKEQGDGSK